MRGRDNRNNSQLLALWEGQSKVARVGKGIETSKEFASLLKGNNYSVGSRSERIISPTGRMLESIRRYFRRGRTIALSRAGARTGKIRRPVYFREEVSH